MYYTATDTHIFVPTLQNFYCTTCKQEMIIFWCISEAPYAPDGSYNAIWCQFFSEHAHLILEKKQFSSSEIEIHQSITGPEQKKSTDIHEH